MLRNNYKMSVVNRSD